MIQVVIQSHSLLMEFSTDKYVGESVRGYQFGSPDAFFKFIADVLALLMILMLMRLA